MASAVLESFVADTVACCDCLCEILVMDIIIALVYAHSALIKTRLLLCRSLERAACCMMDDAVDLGDTSQCPSS